MSRSRIVAGKAVVLIEASDLTNRVLKGVKANMHRLANDIGRMGEGLFRTGFFSAIGSGLILKTYANYSDLLLELRVSLGYLNNITDEQKSKLKGLEGTMRSLGKAMSFTTSEVVEAAIRLAKAGEGPERIEKMLPAMLNLARGTRTATDVATDAFIRSVRAFNLNVDESQKIASQFALATRLGVLDLDDLEYALRYSQGTAASLGDEFADILAIMVELSNKGLPGSIGGTSLNTLMTNLVKKSQELGVELNKNVLALDPQGGVDVIESVNRIFQAMKAAGMSRIQMTSAISDIFNIRGARAALAMENIENIQKLADTIRGAGTEAKESAEIMDSGLGGAWRRTAGSVEDLAIALGKAVDGPISKFLDSVTTLINKLNELATASPGLSAAVIFAPAALLASGVAMLALSKALHVAASAAGVFQGVWARLMGLFTKGTAGQISALLSPFTAQRKGKKVLPPVKGSLRSVMGAGRAGLNAAPGKIGVGAANITSAMMSNTTRAATAYGKFAQALMRVGQGSVSLARATGTYFQQSAAVKKLSAARIPYIRSIYAEQKALTNLKGIEATMALRRNRGLGVDDLEGKRLANLSSLGQAQATQTGAARRLKAAKTAKETAKQAGEAVKAMSKARVATAVGKGKDLFSNLFSAGKAGALKTIIQSFKNFGTLGKGLLSTGRAFLSVANGIRRFAFSASGVLLIVEVLLLFGHRIPGINRVLERLGKAFTGAFTEIGKVASYFVTGPWELFKTAFEGFSAGSYDIGVQALVAGFSSLVDIVGNQLVAAWNTFKSQLGPVYDFFDRLATTVVNTFSIIIEVIGQTIESSFTSIGKIVDSLVPDNLMGGGDRTVQTSWIEKVAQFFPQAVHMIGSILIQINEVFDKMLAHVTYYLNRANMIGVIGGKASAEEIRRSDLGLAQSEAGLARAQLAKALEAATNAITDSFNRNAATDGAAGAGAANAASVGAASAAATLAQTFRDQLAAMRAEAEAAAKQAQETPTPAATGRAVPDLPAAAAATKEFVSAVVGSIQNVTRNLVGPKVDYEKLQYEEQKTTNDILRGRDVDIPLQ